MRIVTEEEFNLEWEAFFQQILDGAIFIYPTDTIYGIGCDARNKNAVEKIREIKNRSKAPFSVIAPSVDWIKQNCVVTQQGEEWLKKLPGPYTLIFRLKNPSCIAPNVTLSLGSIGVRMPNHWMMQIMRMIDAPIVTTSVNKTGEAFMTSLDDLDHEIKAKVDFMIDEGEKKGKPSTIIHLEQEEVKIRDRSKE